MQLKNYMEELVWENLDSILERYDEVCKCEKCRYDIAAITLNALPPRYFVTDMGGTYTRIKTLDQQFFTDVTAAITSAIGKVKSRPHHA